MVAKRAEKGRKMISAKRAMSIFFEQDADKRNKLVDKLSEEDSKFLLKQCLAIMREGLTPTFEDDTKQNP